LFTFQNIDRKIFFKNDFKQIVEEVNINSDK